MKKLIPIVIALSIQACGKDPGPNAVSGPSDTTAKCSNPFPGTYQRLPGPTEIITLNSDCSGTFAPGGLNLTFKTISATQVRITYSNGTEQTCSYAITSQHLNLNCGSAWVTYTKV